MQNDQIFGQPDLIQTSQRQHDDIPALMPPFYDLSGYPMIATTVTSSTDWDISGGMKTDLGLSPCNVSDTTSVSYGNLHIGSFDWNSEPSLFQDPQVPFFLAGSGPETAQCDPDVTPRRPLGLSIAGTGGRAAISAAPCTPLFNPYTLTQSIDGLDHFFLSEPSHNSVLEDSALGAVIKASSAEVTNLQSKLGTPSGDHTRQSTIMNDLGDTKIPNRTLAPLIATAIPSPLMGSSFSESCDKGAHTKKRPLLPKLTPVPPVSQTSKRPKSGSTPPEWPIAKLKKRPFPRKKQGRLPRLTPIPEGPALQHLSTPAVVKFTIDSTGKAHVEAIHHATGESQHDGDSETETSVHELKDKILDAARDIRKILESRKKRLNPMRQGAQQRPSQGGSFPSFQGDSNSPPALTESSLGESRHVRCFCDREGAGDVDDFMIHCDSCDMWLHGGCINMSAEPRRAVYICRFCTNISYTQEGRGRNGGRRRPQRAAKVISNVGHAKTSHPYISRIKE